MHLLHSLQEIDFSNIHDSKKWNLHPFLLSKSLPVRLVESIRNVGLLQPPILQEISAGNYQLICGRSRLQAFKLTHSDTTVIPCSVITAEESAENLLSYTLEDQLLSGQLTVMEKSYFFSCCLKHMTIETAARKFLSILNEKVQPHSITKLLTLLKLEETIQASVHKGLISEKIAYELLKLKQEDRDTVYTRLIELKLGGGKQKRFLSLCKDLAYRENKTIVELLQKDELRNILALPPGNEPQKAAALLTAMQKLLFPQSVSAEELFKREITAMNLPLSCTVSHSLSFETDAISLTIQFKNLMEMEKQIPKIRSIAEE